MDVVRFDEAPFYTAPNHGDVEARRLQGGEASAAGFALVGHSTLPAGAVIPMEASGFARIYVVTEGVLTIENGDGVRYLLGRWDSIHIPAGERRAVRNQSDATASMIVVTPAPAPKAAGNLDGEG